MRKNIMLLSLALLVCIGTQLKAQVSFSAQADLQSRYVWRGQPLGSNSPSIQPGATVNWHGLSLGVWGAYSITAVDYQELDWTLSYTFCNDIFQVQLTDYSFPTLESDYRYFDYRKDHTDHVLEAGLKVNIPTAGLSLSAYCNLWGNDAHNSDGSQVYSAYAELAYSHEFSSINTTIDCAAGCALNSGDMGSFYGNDGLGLINLSLGFTYQPDNTSWLRLPFYSRLIANPVSDKMWLICGTTIPLSR